MQVYVQNLAIEFGPGGNKRVCPMAKASELHFLVNLTYNYLHIQLWWRFTCD